MNTATATRDDHLIAGFAALAIAIHIIESAFPSPLPGVKPGLANVVTLIVLFRARQNKREGLDWSWVRALVHEPRLLTIRDPYPRALWRRWATISA